jgi:LacI family transcriptional regulator
MTVAKERFEGFKEALAKKKIKIDHRYVINTDLTRVGTEAAMKELLALKRRPTAIITFNDYVALDAMRYAKKQKIVINKDISFVSFANLPITHYMENPPLASVEQFPYEQGRKAAEILFRLLELPEQKSIEPVQITLNSELVVHARDRADAESH